MIEAQINGLLHRPPVAALSAAVEAEGASSLGIPERISATGGKWYFDDMQEWPDTLQVNYEFAGAPPRLLTYEMRVWCPYQMYGESEGAAVFGDQAYIVIGNTRWRAFAGRDELIAEGTGDSFEGPHVEDFLTCVKTRNRPRCDLATVGHAASVLCHAGNIAARVGRTLTLSASEETFDGDPAANELRGRPEWRRPWVLPTV